MFANNDNEKTIKTYASLLQDIRESHVAVAKGIVAGTRGLTHMKGADAGKSFVHAADDQVGAGAIQIHSKDGKIHLSREDGQAGLTKSSYDSVADAVKAGIKMSGRAK